MANVMAFSVDPVRDADIIDVLSESENRSELFRKAMRAYIGKRCTMADDIAEIKALLKSGIVLQAQEQGRDVGNGMIDAAMARLDSLGL